MNSVDVVIVGGGGSGLAAAARCAELGLSVLVLEKQPQPGGTTGIAVGSFTASNTSHQVRAGIEDSSHAHAEDVGLFAEPEIESRNNHQLREFFLSRAAETLQWLDGLGLVFHGPSPEPPNRVARMHNVVPNAKAYIAALQAVTLRKGGKILCNAEVTRLIQDKNHVVGVEVLISGEPATYHAHRGVILAAGDYSNSTELIAQHKGDRYSVIEGINPHSQGDGHRLAEAAGAQLLNMDITYGPELRFVPTESKFLRAMRFMPATGLFSRMTGKLLPFIPKSWVNATVKRLLVTWQHPEVALFRAGAILVNREGNRFCEETVWPDRELSVAQQPGKEAFILLDARLIDQFSRWPHFISTAPEIAYAYVDDYLRLRPDVTRRAQTLVDLARAGNIPEDHLRQTVESTNSKRRSTGEPLLEGEPWVLLGPLKAYFTTTEGGAAISQDLEVLNASQTPIQGLYAIGQNGLGGQILWGHGLHIAWAITSGRLVAEHLAGRSKLVNEN